MAAEVLDVVVSALAAGATAGVKDSASAAVKDAYAGLLAAARRRFGLAKAAELEEAAAIEDTDTAMATLTDALDGVQIAPDDELVTSARTLLGHIDPAAARREYVVDARGAQGVQVGSHGTIVIHNHGPRDRDER